MPALALAPLADTVPATGAPLGLSTAPATVGILPSSTLPALEPELERAATPGWTYSWPFASAPVFALTSPASVSLACAMKTAALAFLALSGVGTGGPAVPALSTGTGTDRSHSGNGALQTEFASAAVWAAVFVSGLVTASGLLL